MKKTLCAIVLLGALAVLAGCAAFGVIANAMPKIVPARYAGLANQSAAVMVWVDRGVRTDYPNLQLDIANGVQSKLQLVKDKKELENVTWPWEARSVVRYQRDHPEVESAPVTETAARLSKVTRLIYVEVEDFSLTSEASLQLYRGFIQATLRVVETDAAGGATVVYTENDIKAYFPPKSPPEGVPAGDPVKFYKGTLDEFTTAIAVRFFEHEEER